MKQWEAVCVQEGRSAVRRRYATQLEAEQMKRAWTKLAVTVSPVVCVGFKVFIREVETDEPLPAEVERRC